MYFESGFLNYSSHNGGFGPSFQGFSLTGLLNSLFPVANNSKKDTDQRPGFVTDIYVDDCHIIQQFNEENCNEAICCA